MISVCGLGACLDHWPVLDSNQRQLHLLWGDWCTGQVDLLVSTRTTAFECMETTWIYHAFATPVMTTAAHLPCFIQQLMATFSLYRYCQLLISRSLTPLMSCCSLCRWTMAVTGTNSHHSPIPPQYLNPVAPQLVQNGLGILRGGGFPPMRLGRHFYRWVLVELNFTS